jgi:hypothetical protein
MFGTSEEPRSAKVARKSKISKRKGSPQEGYPKRRFALTPARKK